MKREEIVLQQRNWGKVPPINYKVVKLVNRLTPRIGEVLTAKQVEAYLDQQCDFVEITIVPSDKEE